MFTLLTFLEGRQDKNIKGENKYRCTIPVLFRAPLWRWLSQMLVFLGTKFREHSREANYGSILAVFSKGLAEMHIIALFQRGNISSPDKQRNSRRYILIVIDKKETAVT